MTHEFTILGILFFLLFLWQVTPVLSPLLLALLVWLFLYPMRRSQWVVRVLVATTTLLVLWFLYLARRALMPFVWGAAVAYLLDPFVDRLQRLRIPRLLGAFLLVFLLTGLMVAIALLVLPTAAGQIRDIISHLPEASAAAGRWWADLQARTQRLGVPLEFVDIRERILGADTVLSRLAKGALDVTKALSGALSGVISLVLVVVVSFYLLVQIDRLSGWLRALIPPLQLPAATAVGREIDAIIGSWFRGQLLVALLVGVLTASGLALLRAPYAALLGLVAGALNIIPTIGLIASLAIAILLAPTVGHPLSYLVKVGVVFAVVQVLDSVVISAQIMRARMGLHPAVVIVSVVGAATLFGAAGVLLAVPAAALVRLGGSMALAKYRTSAYYLKGAPAPECKENPHDAD
ncbi:MAG: AI-2E family transporter [Candidatus Eisenbacteria bacterium]|jgi:predicted PurR-regulated permease PerM|nr:AI-2E family transporter [Candidatus Eisenbacteria bacterium]